MNVVQRFDLVKRNTAEIVTEDELKDLLKKKKQPAVYLGTAITGRPHIGYFVWVLKMADLTRAGFKVKVLLADVHGALDNCPWEVLDKRYKYYEAIIPLMFEAVGADLSKLEFVKGSSFELDKDYAFDIYKATTLTTVHDALKAGSEVVKHSDNPKLSGLLYPILQAIDEVYLDVDMQYGGVDQRKIFMFARELHRKMGRMPRVELMTPLMPGLVGKKMSASDPKSKVDLLDDEKTVTKKINGAFCEAGVIEDNGVLAFLRNVVMVLKEDRKEEFVIERPEKFGGNISFKTYDEVEKAFAEGTLHPADLKAGLAKEVNSLLEPIRKKTNQLEKLSSAAYQE